MALALAGCDGVFGLQALEPPVDAPLCFTETFDDDLLAVLASWDRKLTNPDLTVDISEGQLHLEFAAFENGYATLASNMPFDLTNKMVTVEVTAPLREMGTDTTLNLQVDNRNYYKITAAVPDAFPNQGISYTMTTDGMLQTACNDAFDVLAHRFWRIAHEGATVVFYTSAEGSNWVERCTVMAPTVPVSALEIEITAGYYGAAVDHATRASYDNVAVCPR